MLASPLQPTTSIPATAQRARGSVELAVSQVEGRSQIARLYQSGCAKARIPRSAGTALEAILINSSGGMTSGDRINWQVVLEEQTHASLTSQACERVYKAPADTAEVVINLRAAANAKLAWLPQETILFDQGRLQRHLDVELAPSAEALLVEPIIFGRGAMGERVTKGHLQDRWRIKQGGKLIHAEDLLISGDVASTIDKPFVLNGHNAMATILFISPSAEGHLGAVRDIIGGGGHGGASAWNGKLLARITAEDGYNLRKRLVPLINLLNFEARVPKVWAI